MNKTQFPSSAIRKPGYMYCWLSGMTPSVRPANWYGPWGLELAHIASGAGKAVRKDDARAVVLLCSLAHRLHVSDADRLPSMNICERDWPTIDERHTLWLKREMDGSNYDEAYLQSIFIGKLPTPTRPPDFWCRMFMDNTGMLR
jgi:hypothetical protein